MNKFEDSFDDKQLHELMEDLSSVRINDFKFTEEEKRRGLERLQKRMRRYDWWKVGRCWAVAASVLVVVAIGGWMYVNRMDGGSEQEFVARVVPADNDILLTMNDGFTMNLHDKSELVCSADGGISVDCDEWNIALSDEETGTAGKDEAGMVDNKMYTLVVPDGKRTSVRLADGSRLWINSGSEVEFPACFNGKERCIKVNGEIYIEVAHDADKPFRVRTAGFDVKVLGTKFGITAYRYSETANVVLAEGTVAVESPDNETISLSPSQLLTFSGGTFNIEKVDPYTYISWKDDLLYFNGTPISEVLQRLSHQYAVNISCSTSVAKERLYGKLVLEEHIEDVLDNLSVISSINYTVKDNKIIVDN